MRPLLHFLVLGALLFAAARWLASRPSADPIAASAASDEELLVREARQLGLDRGDPVVRGRLVRNLRLTGDPPGSTDALYRQALALGMDQSDFVVRHRLAERMEARLRAADAGPPAGEAELRAYYEQHVSVWTRPAAFEIAHVFFSRARRGAVAGSDARAELARLRAARVGPDAGSAHGDPCLLGSQLPLRSQAALARDFGPAFSDAVAVLEPGAWSEPIASSYGVHLVWVRARAVAEPEPFEAVRARVEDALRSERSDAALRAGIAALRAGGSR